MIVLITGFILNPLVPHITWAQTQESTREQKEVEVLDTLEIRDMDINDVLKLFAAKSGLNIIAGKSINGRVTIFLQNVKVRDALTTILKANDLAYLEREGVIQIMTAAEYEQATGHQFGVTVESTIVTLQSAKASDVVAILNQVKSQTGKIIADDQSNSIIIEDIAPRIQRLLEYVKTIDAPTQTEVYELQFIPGEPLVAKLKEMSSPKIGNVKFDSLTNKLFIKDTVKKLVEIKDYINQIDRPRETKVFQINYAKSEELAKAIGPMLTKDMGSVHFDARSNTLVVMDILPKINEIELVVNALDKNDKEVFIEAKIVQIALGDNYQMGINWETLIPNAQNTVVDLQGNFALPGGPITNGVATASIGTLNRDNYRVVLQALEIYGKSRTLSNPHLAVINNQEASILIGTTIPYTTSTVTTPASGPTVSSENVNFIDTGVKLHVIPTIHDDGFITMKIKPEISNEQSTPFIAPDGSLIPIVDTSEVQTTVRVKDGVTIIIGGLIKDQVINNQTRIPLLGSIPILGRAFKNENHNMQKTEIIIFLTPHIINGDVHKDADEYISTRSPIEADRI